MSSSRQAVRIVWQKTSIVTKLHTPMINYNGYTPSPGQAWAHESADLGQKYLLDMVKRTGIRLILLQERISKNYITTPNGEIADLNYLA